MERLGITERDQEREQRIVCVVSRWGFVAVSMERDLKDSRDRC